MSSILSWIRRAEPTPRALLKKRLILVVGPFALLGAGMELFMIKTGFYEVATRKEAERQLEAADLEYQRYRQEKKRAQQQAAALAEQHTQPNKKQ